VNLIAFIFGFIYYLILNFQYVMAICSEIKDFYDGESYDAESVCSKLSLYYYIWIINVIFLIFLRVTQTEEMTVGM